MAERLSDIEQRIDSIEQLSSVVTAYRGIAAAHLHEARERLEGIRSYATTVADAIGQALGLMAGSGPDMSAQPGEGAHLVIVLCSEQGFVGNFNTRILEEAEALIGSDRSAHRILFVVGDRGGTLAEERGLAVDRTLAMAAHVDEVTSLGNRLAEALYACLADKGASRATIVHAVPGEGDMEVTAKSLVPFDFGRFPLVHNPIRPLVNLPLEDLVSQLAEEYVFAELCEAVMLSYAAENEKRMMAMLAARNNVEERFDELTATARRMRQEAITAEVTELAAGMEAEREVSS